jgi:hypothetical protein
MPANLTTLEDLRRAAVEQEQLGRLRQMEEHLERFDSCVLSQVSLESLGVSIGQPLDIDDVKRPRDLSTRFFQPWVPDGLLEEATAYCSLIWMDRLRSRYNPCEWEYGDNKARWFHACLKELYSMDPELWEPWQYVTPLLHLNGHLYTNTALGLTHTRSKPTQDLTFPITRPETSTL